MQNQDSERNSVVLVPSPVLNWSVQVEWNSLALENISISRSPWLATDIEIKSGTVVPTLDQSEDFCALEAVNIFEFSSHYTGFRNK